ncbi:MAG: YaiI/YqxD family protein [Methylococcaceae bacterium]|nr:YaiI/YqxD family protein [Methylococcaceae bacterium]
MKIWVDADACPNVIKEILFRAADRKRLGLTLVANQSVRIPPSPYIKAFRVQAGFDEADKHIARLVEPGDLVITADIPLAAEVVEKGAYALNPRGELYHRDNIRERLAMRNLMEELRSTGIDIGGPGAFNLADRQAFANRLDVFLNRRHP